MLHFQEQVRDLSLLYLGRFLEERVISNSGWQVAELGLKIGQANRAHGNGCRGTIEMKKRVNMSDVRYLWHGARNYVELKSQDLPAHIFRLRRRVRREEDFDYYM